MGGEDGAGRLSRSTEADGMVVEEGFCESHPLDLRAQDSIDESLAKEFEQKSASNLGARISVGSAASMPPTSPFGDSSMQREDSGEPPNTEKESRLEGVDIPQRLLTGLSSLSHDDFTLYMQLTEELAKELEMDQTEVTCSGRLVEKDSQSSVRSIHEDEQLQSAVRKLESMLPKEAISQLQSYASYGLLDVLYANPSQDQHNTTDTKQTEIQA